MKHCNSALLTAQHKVQAIDVYRKTQMWIEFIGTLMQALTNSSRSSSGQTVYRQIKHH